MINTTVVGCINSCSKIKQKLCKYYIFLTRHVTNPTFDWNQRSFSLKNEFKWEYIKYHKPHEHPPDWPPRQHPPDHLDSTHPSLETCAYVPKPNNFKTCTPARVRWVGWHRWGELGGLAWVRWAEWVGMGKVRLFLRSRVPLFHNLLRPIEIFLPHNRYTP